MMLWQQFLAEWVAKVWRSLRAHKNAPLSALLEKITWRKMVFVAALLIAAIALAQLVSLDLAFFMAGDIAFYCEIAGAILFVVAQGHIRQSVHTARRTLIDAMRRTRVWRRRGVRARHRRTLKAPNAGHKKADDEGGWFPELPGLALQP